MLAAGAQAGGDAADAGPLEQADRRVALQRHDRWPVSDLDRAGTLPEGHVVKAAAKLVGQTDELVPLPPRR